MWPVLHLQRDRCSQIFMQMFDNTMFTQGVKTKTIYM